MVIENVQGIEQIINAQESIILFGGTSGCMKTTGLLLAALTFATSQPGVKIKFFKRNFPQLTRPGGCVDFSKTLFRGAKATFVKQTLTWEFENSSTIAFHHITDETPEYLQHFGGMYADYIFVDDAQDYFEETTILFLLSRLRTATEGVIPKLIMSCTANHKSFLKSWVLPYLDKVSGIPILERCNEPRFFIVFDGKLQWGTEKELKEQFSGRLIYTYVCPISFRFIPSTLFSNPALLPPNNYSYLRVLDCLDKFTRDRYMFGSWNAP